MKALPRTMLFRNIHVNVYIIFFSISFWIILPLKCGNLNNIPGTAMNYFNMYAYMLANTTLPLSLNCHILMTKEVWILAHLLIFLLNKPRTALLSPSVTGYEILITLMHAPVSQKYFIYFIAGACFGLRFCLYFMEQKLFRGHESLVDILWINDGKLNFFGPNLRKYLLLGFGH